MIFWRRMLNFDIQITVRSYNWISIRNRFWICCRLIRSLLLLLMLLQKAIIRNNISWWRCSREQQNIVKNSTADVNREKMISEENCCDVHSLIMIRANTATSFESGEEALIRRNRIEPQFEKGKAGRNAKHSKVRLSNDRQLVENFYQFCYTIKF